jgi:hypothetical protein
MTDTKPAAYVIPADLLDGLKDYLMSRPWREVAGAMPRLLELKPVQEQPSTEQA